ncbi:acyl-coenzyme A thioesterase 9, mitochondrial [Cyclospora cayetanensis]|uniref:Acyl-coenzyme A thioesterase 9, mitochondrial n=1 Tax=Cyclospora cayetanensis TaxID=88456 RepID=A0A6P6RQ72_9EIME|nr:acyl-coenzyme A thioesterase 9, mitochondrial [Cyclospora cayetanensis]
MAAQLSRSHATARRTLMVAVLSAPAGGSATCILRIDSLPPEGTRKHAAPLQRVQTPQPAGPFPFSFQTFADSHSSALLECASSGGTAVDCVPPPCSLSPNGGFLYTYSRERAHSAFHAARQRRIHRPAMWKAVGSTFRPALRIGTRLETAAVASRSRMHFGLRPSRAFPLQFARIAADALSRPFSSAPAGSSEPCAPPPSGSRDASLAVASDATAQPPAFPSGEVQEIAIPDRMRMVSWFARHNAIDLSFFAARAKRFEPLQPTDPRPVDYSWGELTLRLSDKNAERLRDAFRQASRPNALRSGRLLEVLDCFAGDIAFAYCWPTITLNKDKTDLFVTVAIDSIRLFDHEDKASACDAFPSISVHKDLTLRGFVTYAGTSSLEITAELLQDSRRIGSAFLVFVHVGKDGRPKKILPPLRSDCDDPRIQQQLKEAEARQTLRRERAAKGDGFRGPDQAEAEFLHNTWLTATCKAKQRDVKWIQDTRLDSNILMQPESISMYGRAFGGYIMRSALELSFLTAQRFFNKACPVITGMEDIRFFDAVRQGDILRLTANVIWSDQEEVQIQVEASSSAVGCPLKRTNRLIFYYKQCEVLKNRDPVDIQVYPLNYGEYMWFLEARRRSMNRRRCCSFVDTLGKGTVEKSPCLLQAAPC